MCADRKYDDPFLSRPRLLAVPEALEVEVEGEHAALEHASEASLSSELPLAVDDLKLREVSTGEGAFRWRESNIENLTMTPGTRAAD